MNLNSKLDYFLFDSNETDSRQFHWYSKRRMTGCETDFDFTSIDRPAHQFLAQMDEADRNRFEYEGKFIYSSKTTHIWSLDLFDLEITVYAAQGEQEMEFVRFEFLHEDYYLLVSEITWHYSDNIPSHVFDVPNECKNLA